MGIGSIWRRLGPLQSGVAPANQTKERSVHELFAGAFRNKSSMWIVLVFLRKNTRIHKNGRNSWTFRFGPFFGLVCRGDFWYRGGKHSNPQNRAQKYFKNTQKHTHTHTRFSVFLVYFCPILPVGAFSYSVWGPSFSRESIRRKASIFITSRKSNWRLSKWGLKVLVHNCPRLTTIVDVLWRKLPLKGAQKGHKSAQL